jgi:hypothetical protein
MIVSDEGWSIAWEDEGDRLTEIGGEKLEHPPRTVTIATDGANQQEQSLKIRSPGGNYNRRSRIQMLKTFEVPVGDDQSLITNE